MEQTAARPKNGRPLLNQPPTTHGGFVAAVPSRAFRDGTGIFKVKRCGNLISGLRYPRWSQWKAPVRGSLTARSIRGEWCPRKSRRGASCGKEMRRVDRQADRAAF